MKKTNRKSISTNLLKDNASKRRVLKIVLMIILSSVLIYSILSIVITENSYIKADEIYKDSRNEFFHINDNSANENSSFSDRSPAKQNDPSPSENFPSVNISFDKLVNINPEIVGWIWIPGTDINYPLLRSNNNEKYLSLSYNLKQTASGSIFVDCRNNPAFSTGNTVIYGHNMKNGSMFGGLKKYSSKNYLESHNILYIYTKDRVMQFKIFAAYKTESDSQSYSFVFPDNSSYRNYIEYIDSCDRTYEDVVASSEAPLVMLSTCTSFQKSERFVVHALLMNTKENDNPILSVSAF